MECIALAFTMPCEILHGTRLFMWSQCIQGLGELCGRYRFDTHLYLIRCTNLQNHIVFFKRAKYTHSYMSNLIPFLTVHTIASIWCSSHFLWCEAWCWGTCEDTLINNEYFSQTKDHEPTYGTLLQYSSTFEFGFPHCQHEHIQCGKGCTLILLWLNDIHVCFTRIDFSVGINDTFSNNGYVDISPP